jgi:hypothetical protein
MFILQDVKKPTLGFFSRKMKRYQTIQVYRVIGSGHPAEANKTFKISLKLKKVTVSVFASLHIAYIIASEMLN